MTGTPTAVETTETVATVAAVPTTVPTARPRRLGAASALLALAGVWSAAVQAAADDAPAASRAGSAEQTLVFTALLDGRPIGEHRYTVDAVDGGGQRLRSTAAFDVKFLGITAYRYRHDDTETWNGAGCVVALQATTHDGGDRAVVGAQAGADGALAIDAPAGRRAAGGCVTTFPSLYWHAGSSAAPRPTQLLNPQDGRDEAVRVETSAEAPIEVRGATVQARHVRIVRPDGPIDLWYAADGAWIGLDALVKGKRLSYRLK